MIQAAYMLMMACRMPFGGAMVLILFLRARACAMPSRRVLAADTFTTRLCAGLQRSPIRHLHALSYLPRAVAAYAHFDLLIDYSAWLSAQKYSPDAHNTPIFRRFLLLLLSMPAAVLFPILRFFGRPRPHTVLATALYAKDNLLPLQHREHASPHMPPARYCFY